MDGGSESLVGRGVFSMKPHWFACSRFGILTGVVPGLFVGLLHVDLLLVVVGVVQSLPILLLGARERTRRDGACPA